MLYIASDHGGYTLKKALINYFQQNNISYEDLGPYELNSIDDYPDYVLKLVAKIRSNKNNNGILLCRNGIGVSIMANRFKGIRAALSFDPKHSSSTRNDDHANVLTLPSDYIDEQKAIETVKAWLSTPYSSAERHIRRTGELDMFGEK